MDSVLPLVTGVLFKIIDEMEDVGYPQFNEYRDYILTLTTICTTLVLYNDVNVSAACLLILIPACFVLDQVDVTYWKTLLILPVITFLLKASQFDFYEFFKHTPVMLFAFVVIYIEGVYITEETSLRKTISRVISILFSIAVIYFADMLPFSQFVYTAMYSSIGYCITSIAFKTFLTPAPKEEAPPVAEKN